MVNFSTDTKLRELFIYIFERIHDPLKELGLKYSRRKNDIYKKITKRFKYKGSTISLVSYV